MDLCRKTLERLLSRNFCAFGLVLQIDNGDILVAPDVRLVHARVKADFVFFTVREVVPKITATARNRYQRTRIVVASWMREEK